MHLKILGLGLTVLMLMQHSVPAQESPAAFRFYNIVPCNPGREELLARDAVELEARTGIDIALYSLTLHPEGFPASRKADFLVESYRKFSRALRRSKVRPGVMIQSILGHWPRVDKEEEKWTRTVDLTGRTVRFCPLDPGYRNYIFRTVAALAKERPCFILGDDDIRSFSPHAECFCKLHTAEFNRRTGRKFTPEEYRKAVAVCKVGDEIFTAYEKLRQDTVNGVCRLIREAIDSVDPAIPAGTCMPGWELHFNGFAARAIAAKGQPPVMRIANGKYMEVTNVNLAENHLRTQSLRQFWKDIPVVLDEADTCPHSLFSKSAVSVHAKLCSSIFAGVNGAKIWYVNMHKRTVPVNRRYTAVLEKYRHYYPALAKRIRDAAPAGVIIPMHDRFPNWHPGDTGEKLLSRENWVHGMLGIYGIPFSGSFDLTQDGIYAIAGTNAVDRLSDAQIRQLMTRKVLLDGPAAAALTRRGFASGLGVSAEQRDFRFNREISSDGKCLYPISKNGEVPFLTVLDPKAEVLTWLGYAAFSSSPDIEKVAPGAVLYRNAAGGVICTTAFHSRITFGWAQDVRKEWLIRMLERLNGAPLPFVAAENQWIMLLHRKTPDGGNVLGFFNLGFDPLEKLEIRCAEKPAKAEILLPSGKWEKLGFSWKDNILSLPVRLECYQLAVIRLTRP